MPRAAGGWWSPWPWPSVAAGADGVMIEVHNDPVHALSDGKQSVTPEVFDEFDEGSCARWPGRSAGRYSYGNAADPGALMKKAACGGRGGWKDGAAGASCRSAAFGYLWGVVQPLSSGWTTPPGALPPDPRQGLLAPGPRQGGTAPLGTATLAGAAAGLERRGGGRRRAGIRRKSELLTWERSGLP